MIPAKQSILTALEAVKACGGIDLLIDAEWISIGDAVEMTQSGLANDVFGSLGAEFTHKPETGVVIGFTRDPGVSRGPNLVLVLRTGETGIGSYFLSSWRKVGVS